MYALVGVPVTTHFLSTLINWTNWTRFVLLAVE